MTRDRNAEVLTALLTPAIILPLAIWLAGLSPFWGDLSYLHRPWRILAAEIIQRGALPLWDPYAYLGMPLAAEMQCAVWYPGTLPFHIFHFPLGLAIFHSMHYDLAGFFAFLWLRKEKLGRAAAFAGAAAFMGCGGLVSRVPFLNHLSTLAYLPAFLLLRRHVWLLGLGFALSFLSGYPLMMAGGAAVALFVPWIIRESRIELRPWLGAALLSAAIGACLLIPAIELFAHSHRGAGLALDDMLKFGLKPSDWPQWISPLIVPSVDFSPSINWWKTCYLGFASWLAIGLAIAQLKWRARIRILLYLFVLGGLLLGGSTTASRWVWAHFMPLRFVRYPGNLAYLLLPALCFLVAQGVQGSKKASVFALALGCELLGYAFVSQPLMPSRYFSDAGPLVRQLQAAPDHRYLLSPNALHWSQGAGLLDWGHRLYGLENLPYHLAAAANFGEPLLPETSYDFMNFIYSSKGLDATAPYLPWSDVHAVLTRDRLPSTALPYDGWNVWHRYSVPGKSSRALWFDEKEGSAIPQNLELPEHVPDIRQAVALPVERLREDRFRIRGRTDAGWLYLAEPRIEGWEIRLNGHAADSAPALGVFQKFRVPAGAWSLDFRYSPTSWYWGISLTCLVLFGMTAYGYSAARSAATLLT